MSQHSYIVLTRLSAPYHLPSAVVALSAHEHKPILLIEDLDHLLNHLSCHKAPFGQLGDVITLDFADDSTFETAVEEWVSLVDQVPFRLNAGDFNISTSVAFAPYAEIAFTIRE